MKNESYADISDKAPKFLCDAMLGHIGKRLRSAGYDTRIDEGKLTDDELIAIAIDLDLTFLTCDEEIYRRPRGAKVIFLPVSDERGWAKLLARSAGVDWMHAPFTRCLDCNTELIKANATHAQLMPEKIRQYEPDGLFCQSCDKVYWRGSHTDRMRARLKALKSESSEIF